jgi:NitT/TauT family transport system substrate-binding protein
MRLRNLFLIGLSLLPLAAATAKAETSELRFSKGIGIAFLPMMVLEHERLIEKHAAATGLGQIKVSWLTLGGPSVANDALLAGRLDFAAVGTTAMAILWDKTRGNIGVKGAASLVSLPMFLNTCDPNIKSLSDYTSKDRIAVTAVKVSLPALVLQIAAQKAFGKTGLNRYDPLTVSMSHPDATAALMSCGTEIKSHFTSPPFQYQQLKNPKIRTVANSDDILGGPATFSMLVSTERFREKNPKTIAAFYSAYDEALGIIKDNKNLTADIYLKVSGDTSSSKEEILAMLNAPAVRFTATPENTMQIIDFMHQVGMIENKPASWKDLFFPELGNRQGS